MGGRVCGEENWGIREREGAGERDNRESGREGWRDKHAGCQLIYSKPKLR